MRLAAQAKAGFYPAHPQVADLIARHLYTKRLDPEKPAYAVQILDPCAGEGHAIARIASALELPNHRVYTVELDAARYAAIKETLPGSNVLGPASFMGGTQITGFSFGLTYVNPPFDWEYGGGKREEQGFMERAHRLLCPHGVMVLVCPFKAFFGNRDFITSFDSRFEDVAFYKFPDGEDDDGNPFRPYNEIVVFGRKRKDVLPADAIYQHGFLHQIGANQYGKFAIESLPEIGGPQPVSWYSGRPSAASEDHLRGFEIPTCWKAHTFIKIGFTDDELDEVIKSSPLAMHLGETHEVEIARPPLPLNKGHLGILLASGMLDGTVEGPHGVHVVRGSSCKVEYRNEAASTSTENPETGAVTTKIVYSEKTVTTIRCIDQRGDIWTHSSDAQPKSDDEEGGDDDE